MLIAETLSATIYATQTSHGILGLGFIFITINNVSETKINSHSRSPCHRYDEDGNSMPLCRSVCKNMMKSCEFPKDMWRCGESQFFNGYEPEKPTWVNGIATYLRDYFPGQPFVENQYTGGRRNKQPLPVCSPSLEGKGSKVRPSRFILCVALVIGYCLSYLVA